MVQTLKEQAREELQVIQQGLIPEVLIIQQEVLQKILQLEQPGHLPLEVLQREVQVDLKQQPELQGEGDNLKKQTNEKNTFFRSISMLNSYECTIIRL
ncbi:MAG: hypothetical protein ACI8RP_000776 [Urechidicola sp.]